MFSEKCGNEMPDNVKFCPSCGAEQGESKQKTFSGNTVEKKKKNRKPLIIAAAALAVICIAAMLGIAMRKPAISLNQYLTVEFDGAEGYGTASVSIDYEKLISDSRDKMKVADDTLFSSSDLLMFCIDGELEKQIGYPMAIQLLLVGPAMTKKLWIPLV